MSLVLDPFTVIDLKGWIFWKKGKAFDFASKKLGNRSFEDKRGEGYNMYLDYGEKA